MKEDVLTKQKKSVQPSGADYSGAINADMNAAAAQTQMDKFNASEGHGFAAEQANHLYDILTGNDATIVGGDNAKNGADRLVNGELIQTKYCQSATQSVAAGFKNGQYRYINPDGSLMQLEVPSDQYEQAVEAMSKRIARGEVPGLTDPAEAKHLVRKGHFTYQQAKNIAKFGTVDSLTYDAVQGAIVSTSAMGITAVITLAKSMWNGDDPSVAVENAAYAGLKSGGAAFMTTVISSQLARTGLNSALKAPTDAVVKAIGPKASASIANSLRSGANIYGIAAMNNVAKLLRCNFVTGTVMTVVLSAGDIRNAFRGRISGKQLFKNVATVAGGMAGGMGGYLLGSLAGGPVVGFVVSAIAGSIGGGATNKLIGTFVEDDAVALVKIIEDEFCRLSADYMLSALEVDIVLGDINRNLDPEKLMDMFASADQRTFAEEFVRGQIERQLRGRCRIYLPSDERMLQAMGMVIQNAADGTGMFATGYTNEVDPVAIGKQLTGREMDPHAAKKGLYAATQMNIAQSQAELQMGRMHKNCVETQEHLTAIYKDRETTKNELSQLFEMRE